MEIKINFQDITQTIFDRRIPEAMTMRTLQQLAEEAIQIQDASNLSGVVHAFSRAMHDLFANRPPDSGTDWLNTHPIVRAWVSKLVSLSRYEMSDDTFEQVMELAGQPVAAS